MEDVVAFHHDYANWVESVLGCVDFGVMIDAPEDLATSARAKSLDTIREKLIRERDSTSATKLDTIRDLAGVRIIGDINLTEQNAIAVAIIKDFGTANCRLVDRRSNDSHGYRALHLELVQHGWKCEIQIRTRLQQAWADGFESLADTYGRQIRYGGQPSGEGETLARRQRTIQDFMKWSETAQRLEELEARNFEVTIDMLSRIVRGTRKWTNWLHPAKSIRLTVLALRVVVNNFRQRRAMKALSDRIESNIESLGPTRLVN